MTKFPLGTRRDHQKFCITEKWTRVRNARGKSGHHETYELVLPNGHILRTRISHPAHVPETYSKSAWGHILKTQLAVTAQEFWDCVRNKVLPNRGLRAVPETAAPLAVIYTLITRFGYTEDVVATLNSNAAIELLKKEFEKENS